MSYEGPSSPPPGGYGTPPPPPGSGGGGYGGGGEGSGGYGGYGGGQFGAGGPGGPMGAPPPNYLVWSILSTLFCCLPLGVASIVFAAQVNSKWQGGDAAGAMESSQKAKKFAIWSAAAAAVGAVLYGVFAGLAVLGSGEF